MRNVTGINFTVLRIWPSRSQSRLLECFQWGSDYDHQKVCEELADVMNYCLLMSDKLGVDAETIILQKLEQNRKKYPVEKAKGKSTKYDQL